jgi:hypothetical protein
VVDLPIRLRLATGGAADVKRAADLYAQGRTCARSVPSWAFI